MRISDHRRAYADPALSEFAARFIEASMSAIDSLPVTERATISRYLFAEQLEEGRWADDGGRPDETRGAEANMVIDEGYEMAQDDRLMSTSEVRKYLGGISDMTLWRRVQDGTIPAPIKIHKRSYWRKSDIEAAIDTAVADAQVAAGKPPASPVVATEAPPDVSALATRLWQMLVSAGWTPPPK